MSSTIAMADILAAARILAVHAVGVRFLLDTEGDDARVDRPGLEVLWSAARDLTGDDIAVWHQAFDLSCALWPNPFGEVN